MDQAVNYEFTETRHAISHLDTENELTEHIDFLTSLAKISGHDLEYAKSIIQNRIDQIEESETGGVETSFPSSKDHNDETFTDSDLKSLFSSLIN